MYNVTMDTLAFQKLDDFFSRFKRLTFKKGDIILRSDEEPRGVLFLHKGYVKLYSISKDAQQLTLIIFQREDFFPLMWAINATPNNYYLEAMGTVELWLSPRLEFIKFLKANSDVLFELTSRILTRLGGILKRMEYLVFGNALSRVASIISICAERFGYLDGKETMIGVILTHQDIANLIGVTRETVSIEIKKLEKKGIIAYQGRHLVIKNAVKLKETSMLSDGID